MKRSHDLPAGLRNRNLQADPRERPNILSKWGLSRCQPMPTPTSYSVQRTCRIRIPKPPNVFHLGDNLCQPGGNRIGSLQLSQGVVVSEPERRYSPLALKLTKLKGLEREGLDSQNELSVRWSAKRNRRHTVAPRARSVDSQREIVGRAQGDPSRWLDPKIWVCGVATERWNDLESSDGRRSSSADVSKARRRVMTYPLPRFSFSLNDIRRL